MKIAIDLDGVAFHYRIDMLIDDFDTARPSIWCRVDLEEMV